MRNYITLFRNLIHVLEADLLSSMLFLIGQSKLCVIGAFALAVMWMLAWLSILLSRYTVITKSVKNKTGKDLNTSTRSYLIGLFTCIAGYAMGWFICVVLEGA